MKTHKLIIPAIAASVLFAAGAVSAQTATGTGGVNVTVTPTTNAITPGSGVTLGTIAFAGDATGASIASFPLTLGATGGGSVSNLSNCRLYDSGGAALTSTVNPVAGANMFAFNSALSVSQSSGTSTVSLRCDVASGTPAGTSFQLTSGTPVFTTGLRVNLDTAPSVPAGSTNVALANILLDTTRSGGAVTVTSIPVSVSYGGGAAVGHLTNCHIRPAIATGASWSNAFTPSGTQTYTLTTPFSAAAGAQTSLSLACDVGANAPVGGTFTIAITPSAVTATNSATGAGITPASGNSSGTVIVTATVGGNTGGSGNGDGSGTPGVPNTGLGGSAAATLAILLLSALAALGGTLMLRRV